MGEQIKGFLLFLGLAFFFLEFAIQIQTGKSKAWFLQKSYPVLLPKAIVFAMIPMGMVWLFGAVIVWIPEKAIRGQAFLYGAMPIFFVGILLAMIQPKWLLPKWYRWLVENHQDILPLLEEEARQLGSKDEWERRAATQKSLEQWVVEVRHKHGL